MVSNALAVLMKQNLANRIMLTVSLIKFGISEIPAKLMSRLSRDNTSGHLAME